MNNSYLSDFERLINQYDNYIKRLMNKGDLSRANKLQKLRDSYYFDYCELKAN